MDAKRMTYEMHLTQALNAIAKDATTVMHDLGGGHIVPCKHPDPCEGCELDYQDSHRDDAHDEMGIYPDDQPYRMDLGDL